jgi:hypothetical protein
VILAGSGGSSSSLAPEAPNFRRPGDGPELPSSFVIPVAVPPPTRQKVIELIRYALFLLDVMIFYRTAASFPCLVGPHRVSVASEGMASAKEIPGSGETWLKCDNPQV